MKKTKVRRLLVSAACVPAMGVAIALPLGGLLAGSAAADTSCYTGCTSDGGTVTSSGSVAAPAPTTSPTTSPSGIAFTGADIEEMAVIGLVATGVGVVLVRSSRRRTA
jgi:hypothetical protein